MGAIDVLRSASSSVHAVIARSERVAGAYLNGMGAVLRRVPDSVWKRRLLNNLRSTVWPMIELRPRCVRLGSRTSVQFTPHVGEFDFDALFSAELDYEREVFSCLESRLPGYDAVLEIGANVGVYTVFFSQVFKRLEKPGQIFAFEPSREAYRRLQENLRSNGVDNVQAFNCAVDEEARFVSFYEPEGHLTNGSFYRDFAAIFSPSVRTTSALAISGAMVADLLVGYGRVLVKVDVEGAEPVVLRSLEAYIARRQPDIVIEVLPTHQDALNDLGFLRQAYRLLNITDQGLIEHDRFVAGAFRDYILLPKP